MNGKRKLFTLFFGKIEVYYAGKSRRFWFGKYAEIERFIADRIEAYQIIYKDLPKVLKFILETEIKIPVIRLYRHSKNPMPTIRQTKKDVEYVMSKVGLL